MTPHALAIGLAIGVTIGVLPTLWGTSLICFGLAWILRLNHLATQFANYLVYPLQVSLFVPYFILGKLVAPASFADLSSNQWQALNGNWSGAFELLLPYQACAAAGWLASAPFALMLVYLLTRLLLLLNGARQHRKARQASVHPETPDGHSEVFKLETRSFPSWQGNQGLARRRTSVRRTSKSAE